MNRSRDGLLFPDQGRTRDTQIAAGLQAKPGLQVLRGAAKPFPHLAERGHGTRALNAVGSRKYAESVPNRWSCLLFKQKALSKVPRGSRSMRNPKLTQALRGLIGEITKHMVRAQCPEPSVGCHGQGLAHDV